MGTSSSERVIASSPASVESPLLAARDDAGLGIARRRRVDAVVALNVQRPAPARGRQRRVALGAATAVADGPAEPPVGPLSPSSTAHALATVSGAAARGEFWRLAAEAGVRRRVAPHKLRHAQALELARESVPLNIVSAPARPCQSRHHLDPPPRDPSEEIINAVRTRCPPIMSASAVDRVCTNLDSGSVNMRFRSALRNARRSGARPG